MERSRSKVQTVLVMFATWVVERFEKTNIKNKSNFLMYYIMRKNFKATFNWTLVIISTNEKDTSILVSVSCLDADRHRLGMWLMAGNILSQEGKKWWNYYTISSYTLFINLVISIDYRSYLFVFTVLKFPSCINYLPLTLPRMLNLTLSSSG